MTNYPFINLQSDAFRRSDSRGYLEVIYEQGEVVLKRSFSRAGVFRGMHWQRPPSAQTKIIRVASGRIIDFVMDLKYPKPRIFERELTPDDGWIGIDSNLAHGFFAMEDTEFEYLCHGAYNESAEVCFSILPHLQSRLGLEPILSEKDRAATPIEVEEAK